MTDLPPGDELDYAVHAALGRDPHDGPPDYSTDWAAFGALVEELERRGVGLWVGSFLMPGDRYRICVRHAAELGRECAYADTLPHALALAVVAEGTGRWGRHGAW